jgi:hypothetical protein
MERCDWHGSQIAGESPAIAQGKLPNRETLLLRANEESEGSRSQIGHLNESEPS